MTQDIVIILSVLGVVGQVLVGLGIVVGLLALVGVRGPLDAIRNLLWGYELWGAFVVAAVATGGSLFYSQVAHFVPCEFCWFQRILMYPLSILTLLIAVRGDNRAARYLIPLPVVGAGTSIYHILIERGVIKEPQACPVNRRRLRHQLDHQPLVRVPHDPDARPHGLPSSHRILGPCHRPESPRHRLPFPPMPSGKRARQQRQQAAAAAPPPVRSKGVGGTRARQASPRALAIGGGIALVIVDRDRPRRRPQQRRRDGGSAGVVTSSDMAGPARDRERRRRQARWRGQPTANNLFKGIPQNGLILGNPKAPVTMEMFIDVQCPICQDYEVNHLPSVVNKYIRPGRCSCACSPGPSSATQSFTGRLGMIAAADQNKGFEYAKVLYDNQGELGEHRLADRQGDGASSRPASTASTWPSGGTTSTAPLRKRPQAPSTSSRSRRTSRARRTSSSAPPTASCRSPAAPRYDPARASCRR